MRFFVLPFLLLNLASIANAEVYKWVDENGRVHFGDRPDLIDQEVQNIETIDIQDKFVVGKVERKQPIPYKGESPSHPLSIQSLTFKEHNDNQIQIGNATYGIGCGKTQPILVNPEKMQLSHAVLEEMQNAFDESGYTTNIHMGSFGGAYLLKGEIQRVNTDVCIIRTKDQNKQRQYQLKLSQYIKIKWELFDSIDNKILYTAETEGSFQGTDFRATDNLDDYYFQKPAKYAAESLLADPKFVAFLNMQSRELKSFEIKDSKLAVSYNIGTGNSQFNDLVKTLNSSAVTIKTKNGHGSGVIISNNGYVLTNAHVVGAEKEVQIIVDGRYYGGSVKRTNAVRDVALIRIDSMNSFSVSNISKKKPTVGEELFVIGTPLDLSLNNSITKGILSAYRNKQGLEFYQTDASINPGNSGGPVYDKSGELVALAVAGVFTRDGASLNVNYLIPIHNALQDLKIYESSPADEVLTKVTSEETKEKIIKAYDSFMEIFE